MSTVEKIAQQLLSSENIPKNINFTWHAGEPLSLPISYYEEAFAVISSISKSYNKTYGYTMQTNAVGLNENWCNFFKRHAVSVGISVDGPQKIHDFNRKTRSGKGTHEQTMNGIQWLKKTNILFSVIAVITSQTLNQIDEFFNFFYDNDIQNIALNPEETEGINLNSSLEESFYQKFKSFLVQLMHRVSSCGKVFYIRELKYGFEIFLNKNRNHIFSNYQEIISSKNFVPILTFDIHGNCYPLAPEFAGNASALYNNFIIGNINTELLSDICSGGRMEKIMSDFRGGVQKCRDSCDYFQFCGGDFPSNKFFEHGTLDAAETSHCKFRRQALIEAIRIYLSSNIAEKNLT